MKKRSQCPTPPQTKSNNRRYRNKRPSFRPDPEHWTRKSSHGWKAKVSYETEDDAWEWLNQQPRLRAQGYKVYRCRVCQKWHIGHTKDDE